METGPRLKVSSDRLVKPGIEPAIPGLQGKRFIHYTTVAPDSVIACKQCNFMHVCSSCGRLGELLHAHTRTHARTSVIASHISYIAICNEDIRLIIKKELLFFSKNSLSEY